MIRLIIIILVFSFKHCPSQIVQKDMYLSVKYIPFTAKPNVRVSESAIHNMQPTKFFSVRNDTINNDSINKIILNKIKLLKKKEGQEISYDLRMECQISVNNENFTFYIDSKKNIILNGNVYSDPEVSNIILENICRPYYSTYLVEERKYWPTTGQKCNDSLEFFKIFPFPPNSLEQK